MGCSNSNSSESKENQVSNKSNNSQIGEIKQNTITKEKNNQIIIENNLILNKEYIRDQYEIYGKIGSGSFGKVFKARSKITNQIRAIKLVQKTMLKYQDGDKSFLKEIQMLAGLDHNNIIKVYEYFEDLENYYVVEELADGGELLNQLEKFYSFSEIDAAIIMRQILSAVVYLHSNNIVHRDLKPENILLENKKEINIKIVDFGTANYCHSEGLTQKVGTPYYIAPEVIKKKYDKKCDVWSCGVIMYLLLCGYPPFAGEDDEEIMENILKEQLDFPDEEWQDISTTARNLISKMLVKDPADRINAEQALSDPWFSENIKSDTTKEFLSKTNLKQHLNNLAKFSKREKLQQACISFLVHHIGANEQVAELRKIFNSLDTSGDGRLTYKEIQEGLKQLGPEFNNELELKDLEVVLKQIDTDDNGYIEYEEFITATINKNVLLSEDNLKIAFDFFDKNKSGTLDQKEIKNLLMMLCKKDICQLEINKMINEIDTNKDGVISLDEFKNLMKKVIT